MGLLWRPLFSYGNIARRRLAIKARFDHDKRQLVLRSLQRGFGEKGEPFIERMLGADFQKAQIMGGPREKMLRQVLFYQLGAFFSLSGEQREHKADMVVRHAVVCEASDAVLAHPAPQTQCAFPEDDLLPVGIDGAPRRRRFLRRADEQSSVLVHKLVFGAESPVSFGGAARFQPRNDKIEAFLRLGFVGQRPFCRSLVGVKQAQCFEKRSCATSAWILQKQGR